MLNLFERLLSRRRVAASPAPRVEALRLPCRADLWCRKRSSISTMLDPDLFEQYLTGDDLLDEEWVVQSNPPCAFKAEFKAGCDALLDLLTEDPGLHATKGWLTFVSPDGHSLEEPAKSVTLEKMALIVRTAERELKA